MGRCTRPIRLKKYRGVIAPCGKCLNCKKRRANDWIIRIKAEEKIHTSALFVTLTYEQPPITAKGWPTVQKSCVQNFFKRLRFNTGRKNIRYYLCAEYGSQTMRPHYHAIIFNANEEEITKAWTYENENIKNGHIHFGTVGGASINYTVKYMMKDKKIPLHRNDDRNPEFAIMSQGLGKSYMTKEMITWHRNNKASYTVQEGGIKNALPRYYRDKIFSEEERKYMTSVQQKKASEELAEALKKDPNYYHNKWWSDRAQEMKPFDNRKKL